MAATHRFLLSSLLICFLIESACGADKVPLFSELKNTLDVTAKPSKSGVLDAGVDKVTITWKLSAATPAGSDAAYKTTTVKLCYAPISQVDRPWRRTLDEISKDKTCTHKILSRPYDNKSLQTLDWTVERDVPTATYFVRVYVEDAQGHEVAFGQNTDAKKTTNLFQVQAISGRHASLDIASICFSVFSVVSLFGFFFNEKRKAKLEQQK